MPDRRVVVDGSNIATEGRTLPSLKQLNEAVQSLRGEFPDAEITVVVDASFGHRIDPSELAEFEVAEETAQIVSPPAGAIGRGDAFLLRIAGKIGATVLSNDSFQEFHGEHEWLFEEGRLIGGKPVPGVGWIFTPRSPVRGVKSRKAVKEAKGKARAVTALASGEELGPRPVPTKPPPRAKKVKTADVEQAIAVAAEESVDGDRRKRRRRKRPERLAEPVNDALTFITFITEHPLGAALEGEVESFTSHGAFIDAGGARCYIPIVSLGDPPPRAAREVLTRGDHRRFVVQAFDPQRRGIELALPEFVRVAGHPTEETIEAEIGESIVVTDGATKKTRRGGGRTAKVKKEEAAAASATAGGVPTPAAGPATGPKPARPKTVKAGRAKAADEPSDGTEYPPQAAKAQAGAAQGSASKASKARAAKVPAAKTAKAPGAGASKVPAAKAAKAQAAPTAMESAAKAPGTATVRTGAPKAPAAKAPAAKAPAAKAPAAKAPAAKAPKAPSPKAPKALAAKAPRGTAAPAAKAAKTAAGKVVKAKASTTAKSAAAKPARASKTSKPKAP